MLAANGFGGLEAGAREAVRNLMEQTGIEDVESLQNALRTGALKVRFSLLYLPLIVSSSSRPRCSLRRVRRTIQNRS